MQNLFTTKCIRSADVIVKKVVTLKKLRKERERLTDMPEIWLTVKIIFLMLTAGTIIGLGLICGRKVLTAHK
jgi:hypothetical protein